MRLKSITGVSLQVRKRNLFAQILKKLTGKANSKLEGESLLQRLKAIEQKDKRFRTFGIRGRQLGIQKHQKTNAKSFFESFKGSGRCRPWRIC